MATKKKFDFKAIGMRVASVGAGAVAGKIVNKPLSGMNPKLRGGLKIVVGAALPEFVKGKFIEDMGAGMIAVGASELVEEIAPDMVSGVGNLDQAIGDIDLEDEGFVMDADVQSDESMSGILENAVGDLNDPNETY